MFEKFEEKFEVIFPENENATYESILNYSTESNNPFQRWYRYKEGFSVQFVEKIVEEYSKSDIDTLMDPFAGSGTTILAANKMGCNGIGFEVNPFSYFLMFNKLQDYSDEDILYFEKKSLEILNQLENDEFEEYDLPVLSISSRVFQPDAEKVMMSCKIKIDKIDNEKIKNLLLLGWLSSIEELSNYRKAGNGLKKRKTKKPRVIGKSEVLERLNTQFSFMISDLKSKDKTKYNNLFFNESCLNFSEKINKGSVDGIIFSPPYANCFDYTEIYKLELWFGGFVNEYSDLKVLRNQSLKSHLNMKYDFENLYSDKSDLLNQQLSMVQNAELWDKRIPQMLYGYFNDMFKVIDNCYVSLKDNGFCAIVVGNSAYGGVVIPTDLILADYASSIGFNVDKIEVDRYMITSSQQYKKTKDQGKYLRESVVCLTK